MSELQRRFRCAVYTRKSTDEGLDLAYTSIDAQRDAGHAFITSRRSEGWIPVADDYDDPAFSGGTLERPALKRLLRDIEADKVDIVVVYKIDRLTRSLKDFSRMVEVFDRHRVSFVSVTQQFNTTDSMGRLMLNILLSFAQFEREVTSERIRDKFVASKKKGYWMHGVPPLGYDVAERRLVINPKEAEAVRLVFRRFVALRSAIRLVEELAAQGIKTKPWVSKAGRKFPSRKIDKSQIYKMLSNRTYLGELRHRDQWFPGSHPPILSIEEWNGVQAVLATSSRQRGNTNRASVTFLLKGLVVGEDGRALTPWHTTKKGGRRYRYYVSTREAHEGVKAAQMPRLPAHELEAAVLTQVRQVLRAPALVADVVTQAVALDPTLDAAQVTVAMTQIEAIWDQLFPAEQLRILHLLIERVVVSTTRIEVRLRATGVHALTQEFEPQEHAA